MKAFEIGQPTPPTPPTPPSLPHQEAKGLRR
jgi:hypothetical protein